MNALISLLIFIIFPLNPLLALEKNNGSQITNLAEAESVKVAGVQKEKEQENIFSKTKEAMAPQPIRKEGFFDLAIPNAHASLILDSASGTILHYDNGKERRQIASLTKMMTAILVMEKVKDLSEEAVVSKEAVYTEGTRVGCPRSGYCISQRLKVGEKLKVIDLMKAMLMNSANDAAKVLAEHVGGTEEKFVEMMNQKAKEMNLGDTHFCSASGLEPDGREQECYSSAYDIARIASHSMQYEKIWEIFRLPNNTEIQSTDGTCVHTILNTDILVNEIPQCLGGKTGFTPLAGRSLLLAATDETGKHKIIAVVLDDEYRWEDIRKMINWTFQSYGWK
jgi:D-alanyl-D-alanine carboxypeptidase